MHPFFVGTGFALKPSALRRQIETCRIEKGERVMTKRTNTTIGRMGAIAAASAVLMVSMAGGARAGVPESDVIRDGGASRSLLAAPLVEPDTSTSERTPILLLQEKVDVDGDGLDDTVSYFSSRPDGPLDAQSIEFGAVGKMSVLAVRCDFDQNGSDNDWLIVDPDTEDVKAALVDTNEDGEVDQVDLGNGRTEAFHGRGPSLPVGYRK
jgi:hypothetical protein